MKNNAKPQESNKNPKLVIKENSEDKLNQAGTCHCSN